MTPERFVALTRDVLCMVVSVLGIAYQAKTGVIHAELLTLYMGLLTWSGGANIWAMRRGTSRGGGSSLGSRPPDSPSPLSSSSGPPGGGES